MVEGWVFGFTVFWLAVALVVVAIAAGRFYYLERRDAARERAEALLDAQRVSRERDEAVRLRREAEEAARVAAATTTPAPTGPAPDAPPEPSAEDLLHAAPELGVDGADGEGSVDELTAISEAGVHELEREAGTLVRTGTEPNPFALRKTVTEILVWRDRTEEEKRTFSLASRAADALSTILRQGLQNEASNGVAREFLQARTVELNRLIVAQGTGVVPGPEVAPAIEEAPADAEAGEDAALLAEAEGIVRGGA